MQPHYRGGDGERSRLQYSVRKERKWAGEGWQTPRGGGGGGGKETGGTVVDLAPLTAS